MNWGIKMKKRRTSLEFISDLFTLFKLEARANFIFGLGFAAYILSFELFFHDRSSCIIKNITGLPCPTCGMTRAYKYFLQGEFKDAFYYHPLFLLVIPVAVIIFFRKDPLIEKVYKNKAFWIIIFTVTIGVYIFRMFTIYPEPPLDPQDSLYKILFDSIRGLFK